MLTKAQKWEQITQKFKFLKIWLKQNLSEKKKNQQNKKTQGCFGMALQTLPLVTITTNTYVCTTYIDLQHNLNLIALLLHKLRFICMKTMKNYDTYEGMTNSSHLLLELLLYNSTWLQKKIHSQEKLLHSTYCIA